EQAPQHGGMVRHPLKDRIAEQELRVLRRDPLGEIRLDELAIGQPLTRLAEHVGRGIQSDHLRLRIPLHQELGGFAGAAAEIEHAARRAEWHLRQEIARRARALILELEVPARAPVFAHQRENFLYLMRWGTMESVPSRRILSRS